MAKDKKKDWLNLNPDFLVSLKKLKIDYEENLFNKNHSLLLQYMKCTHPLKHHKKEIEFRTRMLVSMFRLKGHSMKSLDNYMTRILSNDHYKFPLPIEIVKIKESDNYISSANEFIKNRGFDEQFNGIMNLYITEHHKFGYFFFVIDNCVLSDDIKQNFCVKFDEVTFISPTHGDLKVLRQSVKSEDKKSRFKTYPVFFGRDKLLAYIHTGYEKKDAKKEACLRVVQDELVNLNQYLNGGLQANPSHFLVYESFDSHNWSSNISLSKTPRTIITKFEHEDAAANPYETLRNINSSSKKIILQNEKVFLKAFSRSEVEYFWIFIESSFTPVCNHSDQIRKSCGKLMMKLLEDLKKHFLVQIGNMMTPFNFDYEEENLTWDEVLYIQEEILKKQTSNFEFSSVKKKANSQILKDIISHYEQFSSPTTHHNWNNHFSNLLIDLYAYRNSLLHSGTVAKYSWIKLHDILPNLISRMRWLIIKACRDDEKLGYTDLITSIIK